MTLERILVEWFLLFGALLTLVGLGMTFVKADDYVNLFLYSGTGSVAIGIAMTLVSVARGVQITGPQIVTDVPPSVR